MKTLKLKKSNLPELQKEQVKLLYGQGCSIKDIMEEVDMSYGQIQSFLIAEGMLKRKPKISHKTKEKAIGKLFIKGNTAREIGIELNLKTRVVTYILRKLNLVTKKQNYAGQVFNTFNELVIFRKKFGGKVRMDYASGKSKEEIMAENKISLKSINIFLTMN